MRGLTKKVEWVLERFDLAREDDSYLVIKLWKEYYINSGVVAPFPIESCEELYSFFRKVPSVDDIVRCRQKIQSKKCWLPSSEVMEKRQDLQIEARKELDYEVNPWHL